MPRYLTIYFYQKNPRKIVKKSNKGFWPIQWKGQKTLLWRHECFSENKTKKITCSRQILGPERLSQEMTLVFLGL